MLERLRDFHICALKYTESCFMLFKRAANQENGTSRRYKVLKSGCIHVYFDSYLGTEIHWDSSPNSVQ